MNIKWIGAILIMISCGGFGFYLTAAHKRDEYMLSQLLASLDFMQCELQYRLTPLPDLCRQAGNQTAGELHKILTCLADKLESQISPDVNHCMQTVLALSNSLPERTERNLKLLGASLGRYDLEGQLLGFESIRNQCREDISRLQKNKEERIRSCQTLGLCAGAALVILFI